MAIATPYLRRIGRLHLPGAIRTGLATAVVLSLMLGYALSRIGAMPPMAEGVMALLAVAAVVWCVTARRWTWAGFFRVTAWFMMMFAAARVHRTGADPRHRQRVVARGHRGPAEGKITQLISLALVLVPAVWLALAHWQGRRSAGGTVVRS